jgi:hypothetical protein
VTGRGWTAAVDQRDSASPADDAARRLVASRFVRRVVLGVSWPAGVEG